MMKRQKNLFLARAAMMLLVILLGSATGAWAQYSDGSGTEADPYQISSAEDWNKLCENVNSGTTYRDNYFQLTQNISVTRVVGSRSGDDYRTFNGTFDGGGHTLTVNYTTDAEFCGPFCFTYGATIENLHTAGTINTSNQNAGGVVGRNGTDCLTLINVTSSMTINSTCSGIALHGGLVGWTVNADLIGCAFTGRLLGENSTECGGLIGTKTNTENSSANITDCLFAPTNVTVSTSNACTLARISTGGVVNITNSYYTQALGTPQGKRARSIIAGEYVTVENAGDATAYNVSGITSYDVGIKYNGVLYAGKDDAVNLNLGYTWSDDFAPAFRASGGTLAGSANSYTLTMPDNDVRINISTDTDPWEGAGTETSPYLIAYQSHWDLLADRVAGGTSYSGKHFKLTADISVSRMVGIDEHAFNGTFDGNGHTLTINYSTTEEYAAPFRFVEGATIRNLTVTGTIATSNKYAAGFIGRATSTVTIDNCRSSVAITSTVDDDGTHAGFVGIISYGKTTISDCLFDGSLLGTSTYNNGGFVGWTNDYGGSLTIENSIFAPTEVTMIGDKTFARYNKNHPTITNCYYTETFGSVQGRKIYKTLEEVAGNGLYYSLTAFDNTYYGKVAVTMQTSFDQTDGEIKPEPTVMTEDGTLIHKDGNYTLEWSGNGTVAGDYTVTITVADNAQFPIPNLNAHLIGSRTLKYTVVSMYAPRNLTATTTYNTATINWTGTASSYKVLYRPANTTVTYYTGFENGLPEGWTTIDADGDGHCWKTQEDNADYAHSGEGFVYSESFINYDGPLTPDNWLVSPLLSLNGVLKVWMRGQDPNEFQEHVAIYVSTAGNKVADFTDGDIVLPETIVTNEYVEYSVDLTRYAGVQGFIAIRHFNCTNQFHLDVDDFGLYNADSSSEEWQEIEATETTALITGLNPETFYDYQVVGIVGEDSYPSAVAVLQTKEEIPEVTNVSVAPQQTTANVSWEGHGNSYNVRYSRANKARVTLVAGDVWGDGTGYQMLLDADANTFGSSISDNNGPLTRSGVASNDVYAEFEYKIPVNADGHPNTENIVFNDNVTIEIPAGTYDWCITNPNTDYVIIASSNGNVDGRQNDYVFEAGMHYVFTVSSVDYAYEDRVDVEVSPTDGEWTQVTVENGALTTELTSLTAGTDYVVQVQAVLANGKTSEWSSAVKFTTLGEAEITLNDDGDNQDVIDEYNGRRANVTLARRTLYKDGDWNTLCLPFDLVLEGSPLVGAEARTLKKASISGNTLTLNFSDPVTTLQAGKPYIIKWTSGGYITAPVFAGVTINNTMADVAIAGVVTFKGNYDYWSFTEDNRSILFLGDDNTLYWPKEGATIGACRAYFELANGITAGEVNGARLFFGSGESQGIISIDNGQLTNETGTWYTAGGVKVEKPQRKGLYIHNGRKVVIK